MKANEIIKARRTDLGMTQKELAVKVGVTEATVSRWESGDIKNMRRDKIATLARVLDIPPAVLMDWESFDEEMIEHAIDNDITIIETILSQIPTASPSCAKRPPSPPNAARTSRIRLFTSALRILSRNVSKRSPRPPCGLTRVL